MSEWNVHIKGRSEDNVFVHAETPEEAAAKSADKLGAYSGDILIVECSPVKVKARSEWLSAQESRKSAKFERCVRKVKARGTAYNPWAVCRAQLGEECCENPISKMLAWTLGLAAAAGVGIAGIAILSSSKKPAAPQPTKPPTPSTPVWTRAAVNPQTNSVWLPLNSTFAISVPGDDPNIATITQNLNGLATAGVLANAQSTQPGQAAPAGWPADGLGTNAYRFTGDINPQQASSLYPSIVAAGGVGVIVDQSTLAWIFAGVSA